MRCSLGCGWPAWLVISVMSIGVGCGSRDEPTGVSTQLESTGTKQGAGSEGDQVSRFSLVDHDGRVVTEQSFHGQWLIVFFGFTHCPDVCPTTLARLKVARDLLGSAPLQVALITVDPGRDTPAVLGEYVRAFGPGFIGLTGSQTQIDAALVTFRAYAARQERSGAAGYLMDHSATLYLLDPDGRLSRQFSSQTEPSQLAGSLREIVTAHRG